jgi:hypothetical protein
MIGVVGGQAVALMVPDLRSLLSSWLVPDPENTGIRCSMCGCAHGHWRLQELGSAEMRDGKTSVARPGSRVVVGADSPFFALLGSAPQEPNNIRPEAKLEC